MKVYQILKRFNFNPFALWRELVIRAAHDERLASEDPCYTRYLNICEKFGLEK